MARMHAPELEEKTKIIYQLQTAVDIVLGKYLST